MAGIDKIYGNSKEYDLLKEYLTNNLKEGLEYLYPRPQDNEVGPLSNFPEWIDKRLLKNCPITFVVDRIKDQYNIKDKNKKPKYINNRR